MVAAGGSAADLAAGETAMGGETSFPCMKSYSDEVRNGVLSFASQVVSIHWCFLSAPPDLTDMVKNVGVSLLYMLSVKRSIFYFSPDRIWMGRVHPTAHKFFGRIFGMYCKKRVDISLT